MEAIDIRRKLKNLQLFIEKPLLIKIISILLVISLMLWGRPVGAEESSASTIPGDVDGNGVVDAADVDLISQYVTAQKVIGSETVIGGTTMLPLPGNADVTQDGEITIEDALAISQWIGGQSTTLITRPEYGLPGKYYIGSLVRIEVGEHFMPSTVTDALVRIESESTGYKSGYKPMVFSSTSGTWLYHWDTTGLSPASDYNVYVTTKRSLISMSILPPQNTPYVVLSLEHRCYEYPELTRVRDSYIPAPGIPLDFGRIYAQDSAHIPYLGPFGTGWSHSFNIFIEEFADGQIAFFGPNGFNRWFVNNGNGTYQSSPGDYGILTRDPDGTFQLKEKNGFIYRLNTDLHLDYMQDANGNRASCTYNSGKNLIKIEHSNGSSIRLDYNGFNRISRLVDNAGRETSYEYSADGIYLLKVTAPDGSVTSYTYNGQQRSYSDNRLVSITYPDGTHQFYTYDVNGRIATREEDYGNNRFTYAYDTDGTTHITDAVGTVTTIRVNDYGQPIEVVNGAGAKTVYVYDAQFNLVQMTDPLGRVTLIGRDDRGNMNRATDPMGNIYEFGFEPVLNKLSWLKDSLGRTTAFAYNLSGNLTEITYPNGSSEKYDYDDDNRLQSMTDRNGQMILYEYDKRGLLLSKTYPDKTSVTYTYNATGELTGASNPSGTISLQYDVMGNVISRTYPGNRTFQHKYDADGKLTSITDPDGKVLLYSYDSTGRLEKITDGTGLAFVAYLYDAANRRIQKTLGNGTYTKYEYDAAGHVVSLVNYDPYYNMFSFFKYTYDAAGNCLSKETIEGKESYTYDTLGQLTGVTHPDGTTEQFIYDAMGNRQKVVGNGITTEYTVNELNQYTRIGTTDFVYDNNGNLVSKAADGQITSYIYNVENQLVEVDTPEDTIEYTYNALGLRNMRRDSQGTVNYLWDDMQVAIEENETHQTIASYVWGSFLDETISMTRSENTYYYTQDALQSVADLMDTSGKVVERYKYLAFGEPLVESSAGNPWFYTGLSYDKKAKLQFNRYRDYDPMMGRFITVDPINIAGGLNLYTYVFNNPLKYSDPDGRDIVIATIAIILIITILANQFAALMQPMNVDGPGYSDLAPGPAEGPGFSYPVESPLEPNRFMGGWGMCPTFIQVPSSLDVTHLLPTYLNVSQKELSGKITVPVNEALLRSDIPIFGVAGGTDFKEYRVEYGEGNNPQTWHLINSSTTPQPTCEVGINEIQLMQGDIDIRGNLATWNTGLKEWVHLPWHPAEDPTDFNGIYTIRLVVEGKDGMTVEDRVTCEVGRVIAQCLPGTAVSPDGLVTMSFPEQSLTEPFRVYTILPVAEDGGPVLQSKVPL